MLLFLPYKMIYLYYTYNWSFVEITKLIAEKHIKYKKPFFQSLFTQFFFQIWIAIRKQRFLMFDKLLNNAIWTCIFSVSWHWNYFHDPKYVFVHIYHFIRWSFASGQTVLRCIPYIVPLQGYFECCLYIWIITIKMIFQVQKYITPLPKNSSHIWYHSII